MKAKNYHLNVTNLSDGSTYFEVELSDSIKLIAYVYSNKIDEFKISTTFGVRITIFGDDIKLEDILNLIDNVEQMEHVFNVLTYVCTNKMNISKEEFYSNSGKTEVVNVRNVMYKLLIENGFTYSEIRIAMNKSHPTVIRGVKNVERLLSEGDEEINKIYETMKSYISH